jgi:hypothetical protein
VIVVSDPRGPKDANGIRASVLGVLSGNRFTPIPHGAFQGTQITW